MTYPEYKIAAERHLETCYQLVETINQYEKDKQRRSLGAKELKSQEFLLANLYYLSGYMLECLYNYAICKIEGISNVLDIKKMDKVPPNGVYGNYAICFNYNKIRATPSPISYCLYRKSHRMSLSDLSYLNHISNSISIPLIHNSTPISNTDIHSLFVNWTAYERYNINYHNVSNFPVFNYENVIKLFWELVDICAKISEHIIIEITLFRKVIKKRPSTI